MNNITLEQELNSRVFLHKVAIVGGVLMRNYIVANSTGTQLPPHIIEHEADNYSNKIIQNSIKEGTFNNLYEKIYESLKDTLPDDLKLI